MSLKQLLWNYESMLKQKLKDTDPEEEGTVEFLNEEIARVQAKIGGE